MSNQLLAETPMSALLEQMREELDDHRDAINENTNEVQANHAYVAALERKLDRLAERLDEITLLIKGEKPTSTFTITPLNKKEKDVFLPLYSLTEGQESTTYRELARKLMLSDALVASYVTNMMEKGVPILKTYRKGKVFLSLDHEFRKLQAKHNLIGLNTRITYWMDQK